MRPLVWGIALALSACTATPAPSPSPTTNPAITRQVIQGVFNAWGNLTSIEANLLFKTSGFAISPALGNSINVVNRLQNPNLRQTIVRKSDGSTLYKEIAIGAALYTWDAELGTGWIGPKSGKPLMAEWETPAASPDLAAALQRAVVLRTENCGNTRCYRLQTIEPAAAKGQTNSYTFVVQDKTFLLLQADEKVYDASGSFITRSITYGRFNEDFRIVAPK